MKRGSLILLLAGLALGAGFGAVRLADPDPVHDLRLAYFDYLQRLAPRAPQDLPVRVIDIDEAALAAHGQWPWPRNKLADLQNRLVSAGAAVIVHDVLYSEPDRMSPNRLLAREDLSGVAIPGDLPDNDAIFAESLSGAPTVLGVARTQGNHASPLSKAGLVEVGNAPASGLPVAAGFTGLAGGLEDASAGIGTISIGALGSSGAVRQLPMFWSGPNGAIPTLSSEALRLAFGQSTFTLYGAGDLEGSIEGVAIGDLFIPTTEAGELWLHYRRDDPSLYLSADTVLTADPAGWSDRVEGQIVLIGTSAAGLLDIRTTALGETVPGVSIHAQAIEQILTGAFLYRSDVISGLEVLAVVAFVAAIASAVVFAGPLVATGVGLLGAGGVVAASWFSFAHMGVLFDAAYTILAGAFAFALMAAYRLVVLDRERRAIRQSFSNYVSPEVLGEVERQGHRLTLGGETRDVTVLFSDIRGFTSLSEAMPADALVSLLNELFDAFGQEIMKTRGTIDKFIGDAVMAFWNAPLTVDNHPAAALTSALRMRQALARFNEGRSTPVETAIGVATGPASVGNIGSRTRFNYSVVGDTVNLAARVEAACRHVEADLLVTKAVAASAPELAYLDAGTLAFKGISERVPVVVVAGDEALASSARFKALAAAQAELAAALKDGPLPAGKFDEIKELAQGVEPRLVPFMTRMAERAEDYR